MTREEWFKSKWSYLKKFALLALVGAILLIAGTKLEIKILQFGAFLIIPLLFWLVIIPLLHWKDQYIGEKSTLWGALLVIETSGWFKIIYWFKHILPDWNKTGRYENLE